MFIIRCMLVKKWRWGEKLGGFNRNIMKNHVLCNLFYATKKYPLKLIWIDSQWSILIPQIPSIVIYSMQQLSLQTS